MSNKEKKLILIRGISGSGKTTLADLICGEDEDKIAISSDDYFYTDEGDYVFEQDSLKDSHTWCQNEVETCMTQGFEVIVVHNTLTRRWEVEPYMTLANRKGYELTVVSLYDSGLTDYQLASRSPHKIPLGSVRAQRKRWEHDVFRSAKKDRY